MARKTLSLTVSGGATNEETSRTGGPVLIGDVRHDVDPVVASTYSASKTAFEAALATLVADGASPTQGHATAVNDAYTTLAADLASRPTKTDVVLSYDTTAAPTASVLKKAINKLAAYVEGGGF
jgi:hypothetical protein